MKNIFVLALCAFWLVVCYKLVKLCGVTLPF